MDSSIAVHVERVRRRWALIVVIAVVAALAAGAGALARSGTWTARAALAVVSQNRSPEQDAVLARGYVDLFDLPSLQQEMAGRLGLPEDLVFGARLAAGSPVLYVEATSRDQEAAKRAARLLATTFRDDVRNNLSGDRVRAADDLGGRLRVVQSRLAALPPTSPDRRRLNDQVAGMQAQQAQLSAVSATTVNQLTDLQLDAGVTENPSRAPIIAALALIGGLALGLVLALVLGRFDDRLGSVDEVRARLGREVLAELRPGSGMRALAEVLAGPDLPRPVVLAVTVPGGHDDGGRRRRAVEGEVAEHLAQLRTRQGGSALLVRADLEHEPRIDHRERLGVTDFLARSWNDVATLVETDGEVRTVAPGRCGGDPDELCSRDRAAELLGQARDLADLVVVAVPAVTASAAASVLCAAADRTIVVVEPARTRAADARRALDRVERAGGAVLGVVLLHDTGPGRAATLGGQAGAGAADPATAAAPGPTGVSDADLPLRGARA